ncbi:hypothetical protein GRS48_06255 [Halorubrum sp. JWXQ-INN 858]|uniref:hypothetical protein n=1 Tax=Halorubrum sp. JWXQ-INN 858 TaxID=2690782 RepID=UPI00135AB880|nr:hypothetical protein [Halorubrum sp. JWXQ-INN 858]MWV64426.1 hypothetical protein [Halorubrum sp. JWXQ-INN 858]
MPSLIPRIRFDEHLGRLLLLTLVFTVLLTEGRVLGEVFLAALLSIGVLVLLTAYHGFRYGYVEAKVGNGR